MEVMYGTITFRQVYMSKSHSISMVNGQPYLMSTKWREANTLTQSHGCHCRNHTERKGEPMRLIDADALIDWIDPGHLRHPSELCFSEFHVVNMINHAPTIEPERKRGRWIKGIGENGVTTSKFCSLCHYENKHWYNWNFCPNCGADMRGK